MQKDRIKLKVAKFLKTFFSTRQPWKIGGKVDLWDIILNHSEFLGISSKTRKSRIFQNFQEGFTALKIRRKNFSRITILLFGDFFLAIITLHSNKLHRLWAKRLVIAYYWGQTYVLKTIVWCYACCSMLYL